MIAFHSAIAAARTLTELEAVVHREVGLSELMEFIRFDAAGKRVKSFTVGGTLPVGGGIQALPNGHLLVEGCQFESKERVMEAIHDLERQLQFALRSAKITRTVKAGGSACHSEGE